MKIERFCNNKAAIIYLNGEEFYVSYETMFAFKEKDGTIYRCLEDDTLYSATTARHVSTILNMKKKDYFQLPYKKLED